VEVIEREERLDMKIYHISEPGRTELHHWLSTSLQAADYREPLLIQVYFGGLLSDEEFIQLLQNEIQTMEARLAIYGSIYTMYREMIKTHAEPRAFFLSVSTMEYGILSNRLSIDWLKSVIDRVKSGNYTLEDFPAL
jgi:hypothetical protein